MSQGKTSNKSNAKIEKTFSRTFEIDCKNTSDDGIIKPELLMKFIEENIKYDGKKIEESAIFTLKDKTTISIETKTPVSKKHIKFLIKKYFSKNGFREWLRVVSNGINSYEIRYHRHFDEDEEVEEIEE